MSLDVYLEIKGAQDFLFLPEPLIFIREDGQIKRITREGWERRFPGREPVTVTPSRDDNIVYGANITHNLNTMAREAGIYKHLWRPDEISVEKAQQLIEPLRGGLTLLESDPERFKQFNPKNGWGTYEGLVSFVREYLGACEEYPDADVRIWR